MGLMLAREASASRRTPTRTQGFFSLLRWVIFRVGGLGGGRSAAPKAFSQQFNKQKSVFLLLGILKYLRVLDEGMKSNYLHRRARISCLQQFAFACTLACTRRLPSKQRSKSAAPAERRGMASPVRGGSGGRSAS